MTLADDIAGDLADFDGVETVSLYSAAGNTTDSAVTALRHAIQYRDLQLGAPVGVEPTDTAFNLQASTVTTAPKQGDTITDSSNTVWTVLNVQKVTLGTRYRCACREQV